MAWSCPAEKADPYYDYLQRTGLRDLRGDGWESYELAQYHAEDDDYLLEREAFVTHYEVLNRSGAPGVQRNAAALLVQLAATNPR